MWIHLFLDAFTVVDLGMNKNKRDRHQEKTEILHETKRKITLTCGLLILNCEYISSLNPRFVYITYIRFPLFLNRYFCFTTILVFISRLTVFTTFFSVLYMT